MTSERVQRLIESERLAAPERAANTPAVRRGGSGMRKAYAKADADDSGSITCYLDTDETGDEISVSCEVAGGTNLNAAVPRLVGGTGTTAGSDRVRGTMITVWKDDTTWRSITTFQASEDCT